MPKPIRKVADRYLKDAKEIKIASDTTTAEKIEQHHLIVRGFEQKLDALTRILEAQDFDAVLIFVRTKTNTVELAEKLEARGYSASPLNGDMNQSLRERTVNRLKKKQLDIIVATDVAARGIDVERISHVVNFDIPYDCEAYVHRIGRTGRAGRSGKAILFVAPRERRLLNDIEKSTRQRIAAMPLPSGREVSDKRIANFKQQLTDTLHSQDLNFFYDVLAEYSREADRSAEDIASALAYLLQRERPLKVEEKTRKKKQRDEKTAEKSSRQPSRDSKSRRSQKQHGIEEDIVPMERYRIEVGHNDEAKPGDIVGAIANEAGLNSQHIGHIKLYDDHSTVDLPEGMPKAVMQHLKKVRVRHKPLKITLLSRGEGGAKGSEEKSPKKKPAGKKKPRLQDSKKTNKQKTSQKNPPRS